MEHYNIIWADTLLLVGTRWGWFIADTEYNHGQHTIWFRSQIIIALCLEGLL